MTISPHSQPTRRNRWKALALLPLVAGASVVAASSVSAKPDPPCGALEALPPERFLDTRPGLFTPDRYQRLQIAGVGDVPDDAKAVIINVAAVEAEAAGFVSVVPAGSSTGEPETSNLNIDGPGITIANSAIIPLSEDGAIDIYSSTSAAILIDVLGYVPECGDYSVIDLERASDSRPDGTPAGSTTTVDVVGDFGDPEAELVIINLTLVDSGGAGFLTVYPSGGEFPPTSNLNVNAAGQTRAGLAIVPIGENDSIEVFNDVEGSILVDVLGYLGADSGFTGLDPFERLVDTRASGERVEADSELSFDVADSDDVPATANFLLINVTAVEASNAGFVTVWPGGLDQPEASNLNYPEDGTIANTVLVPIGADGTVNIYTQSEIDLLVDIIGYL